MIQVLLKVLGMFCGLGGQYVMPFITPLINPAGWSSLVLCVFLPIYFSKESVINSKKKDDGSLEKNSGIAFGFAFLIYYTICVILLCSMYKAICKVNEYNPYGY